MGHSRSPLRLPHWRFRSSRPSPMRLDRPRRPPQTILLAQRPGNRSGISLGPRGLPRLSHCVAGSLCPSRKCCFHPYHAKAAIPFRAPRHRNGHGRVRLFSRRGGRWRLIRAAIAHVSRNSYYSTRNSGPSNKKRKEETMRRILAVSVVVALAIVSLAVARSSGEQTDQTLRTLVPRIVAYWETLDIAKISPYYADANFTYFDIAPMKYNNWSEYAPGVQKAFFDPNKSLKAKLNDDLQ